MTTIQQIKQSPLTLLIIAGIFAYLIINNPFGCNKPKDPTVVTVTKTDTQYVQQPPVVIPQYIPVATSSQAPVIIPPSYQPSANLEELLKQYNDLVKKHLTTNIYVDSIKLRDSTGKQVGIVNLDQKVSENQIKSNNFSYSLKFPIVTNTITTTITQAYKPKFQILLGGGVAGSQEQLVNGGFLGIGFKNKKDQIYVLNGGVQNYTGLGIKPQFSVATYIPIIGKNK